MADAQPYGEDVARVYDLIVYGRADAEADEDETAFLRWAFECTRQFKVRHGLDVGCGTGPHLIPLTREGLRVTGVDSSPAMLDECRRKLRRRGLSAELRRGDLESLGYEGEFDAALCMGSVLCYLLDAERIIAALRGLRRALRPGGLLVVENDNFAGRDWDATEDAQSSSASGGGLAIEWRIRHWREEGAPVLHIRDSVTVREAGKERQFETEETLRVADPEEMKLWLEEAGFERVRFYADFDPLREGAADGEHLAWLALRGGP